ncbi:2-vinyl bacteriochlorophyllide hydratase [Roseibium sp. RKSG952]|uniref:2-vinyl bacteriochlorophyllide hydratase n=1 Tax=Roseibium sp. RKSG952 TaxID=2529384 RepID=UPI0012BD0571|nr:2-vinyl bacteriochlorophyllide hydratase [Roseibium sp. RKSG952]MTH98800.1 2-vinyl bacteriochlorophyllide hydratase [Roseibium sp. RKSG952]
MQHKVQIQTLYTPDQRRRRDASSWTMVQGILAPLQFLVFLVSLGLIVWSMRTGEGMFAAQVSVIVKTFLLYTIMVTGSIWEREVFGVYLFAKPFFWEDVFSMLVLALHTWYLAAYLLGRQPELTLWIALAAYAAYVVNAAQFLWKLRLARKQGGQLAAAPAMEAAR